MLHVQSFEPFPFNPFRYDKHNKKLNNLWGDAYNCGNILRYINDSAINPYSGGPFPLRTGMLGYYGPAIGPPSQYCYGIATALPRHCHCTATALLRHCYGTATALLRVADISGAPCCAPQLTASAPRWRGLTTWPGSRCVRLAPRTRPRLRALLWCCNPPLP